ncbi:MFS transporter [Pseudomonas putida]|uniref:MFS transporter n=1 Tax=Pseudomonas putida TaxID=303 RepID=UPI00334555D0
MQTEQRTHVRFQVLAMLFVVSSINYADRAALSIAGSALSADLDLQPIALGYVFSAFGWAYVLGQIPGGWLLDRYGSKMIYGMSLVLWSAMTFLQAFVEGFEATTAVMMLFFLRLMLGLVEAPAFPANGRLAASWFPTSERGMATSIFASAQYFAVVLFSPIMGYIVHAFGWQYVFLFMGGVGFVLALGWVKTIYTPRDHPRINQAEFEYIEQGGGLVNMDEEGRNDRAPKLKYLKDLIRNRMLMGIYLGQYCIVSMSYFFITWFPLYLVQARHLDILQVGFISVLPAVCGFLGGLLSGISSDQLLKRGVSLTWARKVPAIIGFVLASSLVLCNFVSSLWLMVPLMAVAFFGKGYAAIGWACIADASPKRLTGLSGAVFNTVGNVGSIVTPIAIGYIVGITGGYETALVYVAAHCILGVVTYVFIIPDIQRVELSDDAEFAASAELAPVRN